MENHENAPEKELISKILAHCKDTGTLPTVFGKSSVNDPNLVRDLIGGRELRSATRKKINDFLEKQESGAAA